MTNEMLVEAIRNEGREELIPVLWERVQKLMKIKVHKLYHAFKNRFDALGIEKCDIEQECYFVFLKALKQYRTSYKFVTFLEYPLKTMIRRLLKYSLDDRIYTESLEDFEYPDGRSIAESFKDENNDIYAAVDKMTDSEIVRAEVEKLGIKQRNVIKLYYFGNKSDSEIAEIYENKSESICQLRHRALRNLSRSAALRKLYFQPCIKYGKSGFLNPEKYYVKKNGLF